MLVTVLHRFPNIVILIVVVTVVTGITVLAPLIVRRGFRLTSNADREDAAFEGYKAVMGMIGVVLAFSLVQANANVQAVESLISKEASSIAAVDRVLLRIGRPEFAALRPVLADFGNKLVREEWPLLAAGDRSDNVEAAYNNLSRGVRALSPQDIRQQTMYAELLKSLDDLSELREQVIEASEVALPKFFWVTTLGFMVLGLALAGMTSGSLKQTVGVAATAAAVALLLGFVVIVDQPFEGESGVSVAPIENVLERNSHRADAAPTPASRPA